MISGTHTVGNDRLRRGTIAVTEGQIVVRVVTFDWRGADAHVSNPVMVGQTFMI